MPFQQSIFGGDGPANVSVTDVLSALAVLLLIPAAAGRRLIGGPAVLGLVAFLALSVASSAITYDGRATLVSVGRNFTVTLVPLLLFASVGPQTLSARLRFLEKGWVLYVLAATLLSAFVLYTFIIGGARASMYTLAMHKNALGPTLGLGLVVCLAGFLTLEHQRRTVRRMALICLIACSLGLLLSFSRGAWISTAAACTFVLYLSGRFTRFVPLALLTTIALLFVWQFVPEETTVYATDFSTNAYTVQTRLNSIEATLGLWLESPFFGHGVGLRKQVAPHNLIIEMLGEVGLLGVTFFTIAVMGGVVTLDRGWKLLRDVPGCRTLVLIAIGVFMVTLLHGLVDAYWRRGVAAAGWAAVGMVVGLMLARRQMLRREVVV
jgi:O-antigen ligase